MEGVKGQHEYHNKENDDKEENKGWFAILLLLLLQPFAAIPVVTSVMASYKILFDGHQSDENDVALGVLSRA